MLAVLRAAVAGASFLAVAGSMLGPADCKAQAEPERQARLQRLIAAYPDMLDRIEDNDLVWKDGTRMAVDDARGPKDHAALLAAPDIKDMLAIPYPAGPATAPPLPNADPGRARNRAFFDKMYGDCRTGAAQKQLVEIVWLPRKWGKRLQVTRLNGVAERLALISRELDALPARFDAHLFPAAGAFNCRPIAGTNRPSAHGHGIAVDIATGQADYWRWSKRRPDGAIAYRNRIPAEIIAIFERRGFISGSKWYHFDTMHFEYRPELLPP